MQENVKYCEFCGNQLHIDAVLCPKCGKQVAKLEVESNKSQPQIIINNTNQNSIPQAQMKKQCEKWIAFLLCLLIGFIAAHKFYEGKIGLGILYIFTGGLFGIGVIIDLIIILCKTDPYYV